MTKEENFTPLHFAARYTPRLVNEEAQQQQDLNTEDEDDTSTKTVEFLVFSRFNGTEPEGRRTSKEEVGL